MNGREATVLRHLPVPSCCSPRHVARAGPARGLVVRQSGQQTDFAGRAGRPAFLLLMPKAVSSSSQQAAPFGLRRRFLYAPLKPGGRAGQGVLDRYLRSVRPAAPHEPEAIAPRRPAGQAEAAISQFRRESACRAPPKLHGVGSLPGCRCLFLASKAIPPPGQRQLVEWVQPSLSACSQAGIEGQRTMCRRS